MRSYATRRVGRYRISSLAFVLVVFYIPSMADNRPRLTLRTVEGRKPVLDDGRAVLEITRMCKVVGIIDSETGLITDLPRRRPEPGK